MRPIIAYLDPATSSLIISSIVGAFAAAAMLVRRFWYRIKAVLTGGKTPSSPAPAEMASDDS